MSVVKGFSLVLSVFVLAGTLSACGGSGGSGSDSGSSPITPEPEQEEKQAWVSQPLSSDDIVVLDALGDEQPVYKVDSRSLTVTDISGSMIPGGKTATVKISPDGEKIAYIADQEKDDFFELFVANTTGTVKYKVSQGINSYEAREIYWSPDSQKVLFIEKDPDESFVESLYIADFNGDNLVKVTEDMRLGDVVWSPDSTQFFYVEQNVEGADKLFLVDVDDSNNSVSETQLDRVGWQLSWVKDLAWSFDGNKGLLVDSDNNSLYTFDVVGNTVENISKLSNEAVGALWSPDDYRLLYFKQVAEESGLKVHLLQDGDDVKIDATYGKQIDSVRDYTWSQDGRFFDFRYGLSGDNDERLARVDLYDSMFPYYFSESVERSAISSDERYMAYYTDENLIYIVDLETMDEYSVEIEASLPGYPLLTGLEWSSDNKKVIASYKASYDYKRVYLLMEYDLETQQVRNLSDGIDHNYFFCFSMSGVTNDRECKTTFDKR